MTITASEATPPPGPHPGITRRQFTDAFKSEAVWLTQESGRPVAQVARKLGLSDNVLYRWRGEQRQMESQGRTRQAVRADTAHTGTRDAPEGAGFLNTCGGGLLCVAHTA
jgi:transposase-like protein